MGPTKRIALLYIYRSPLNKNSTTQQTFLSTELLLQELLLAFGNFLLTWELFIFQKTNQSVTQVGWKNKVFHHFHFSGKVSKAAILPSQSDITKVPGFFTASDRFWMLSRFSSELNWSTFQCILPLSAHPSFFVK